VPTAVPLVVVGVLLLVGLAITAWVFAPVFRGRDAATAALGSHRLALGSIVVILLLGTLLALPFRAWLRADSGQSTGILLLGAAAIDLPMLLIVYLRLVQPGVMSWQDLGLRPRPVSYVLLFGLGGGLVGFVVTVIVTTLLSQVGLRPNQLDQFQFVFREGRLSFAVVLVLAAIVAPFTEELFFRGFLFGTYRRTKPAWVAYGASSLLFTALHLLSGNMNAAQMAGLSVGICILALLLAWVYDRTGSLYPGMLAHALNNATGLIVFYAGGPSS
jgi:membrane protease YdiL (CAAX protease family)